MYERPVRIALVGDHNPAVLAHRAIPAALTRAAAHLRCEWEWVHTTAVGKRPAEQLDAFDAVWCVPASPYANIAGAIAAIRCARESGRPFLGTCGGFQHAMLEYAEAIWRIRTPAHAELDASAPDPVIAPLSCALVEETGEVYFEPGSALRQIYGVDVAFEGYHCRYGLSPRYGERLASGELRVAARDGHGEVRAVELGGHPFFIGTLYQPERSALAGRDHPLIAAFIAAAQQRAAVPV